jgi:hypothetical protein
MKSKKIPPIIQRGIFIIINIILLIIIFIFTTIGGSITGFTQGILECNSIIALIIAILIVESIIGWIPYKLIFKKNKS